MSLATATPSQSRGYFLQCMPQPHRQTALHDNVGNVATPPL
jgi:hypothetical protein